jgi:hypothetical protein
MMRQPGNSRLFCVCNIDWPIGFIWKLPRDAFAVADFCFTQGSPEGWPPGS